MGDNSESILDATGDKCKYITPDHQTCKRAVWGGRKRNYCVFHAHIETTLDKTIIASELKKEIGQKSGDWKGFIFPSDLDLPEAIDFPIDARWSRFINAKIEKITFEKECNFSG